MSSISEISGQVNATGAECLNARNSVSEAKEAIQRAKRCLFEAMGDSTPAKLMDYMSALSTAEDLCDNTVRAIDNGLDSGQGYIAQLHS